MLNSFTIHNGALQACHVTDPEITVPDGVVEIDQFAFSSVTPRKIILPEGVKILWEQAFNQCSRLETVHLPSTLQRIGSRAFYDCRHLTGISIPSGVTELPEGVFQYCSALRRVQLPEGLTSIGPYAFATCTSLEDLVLPSTLKIIEDRAFAGCNRLRRVVVPEGVTAIHEYAFYRCEALEDISLPSTLQILGKWAFAECTRLRDVVLPPGITSFPPGLFAQVHLHSLQGPGITELGRLRYMFAGVERLTVLRMSAQATPKALKLPALLGFADWEFRGGEADPKIRQSWVHYLRARRNFLLDEALRSRALLALMMRERILTREQTDLLLEKAARAGVCEATASLLEYRRRSFGEADPERENERRLRSLDQDSLPIAEFRINWRSRRREGILEVQKYLGADSDVTVPLLRGKERITAIGDELFRGNPYLISVTVPEGITSLGSQVFADCPNLQRVVLPSTLKQMGWGTFQNCSGLIEVIIPDSVPFLTYACFENCRSLTRVQLPPHLNAFRERAFRGCENLREIAFPEDMKSIRSQTFEGCEQLTRLDLPPHLRSVEPNAFRNCRNLSQVTFPSSLESIGANAFAGCEALTELDLPDSLQRVDCGAFTGCSRLTRVRHASRVSGPAEQWGPDLFLSCGNLRSVHIPAQLQEMGGGVWQHCTNLEGWDVDPENPWLIAEGPWLLTRDRTRLLAVLPGFAGDAIVPDGVLTICEGAAVNCPGLSSVTIPASVQEIQASAFGSCRNLTRVNFLGHPAILSLHAFRNSPVAAFP